MFYQIYQKISNHPAMEAATRLQVLSGWSGGRRPRDLEAQKLETSSGRKSHRQGLKRLQEAYPEQPEGKAELIKQEMDAPERVVKK